jgi:hypothetical protein
MSQCLVALALLDEKNTFLKKIKNKLKKKIKKKKFLKKKKKINMKQKKNEKVCVFPNNTCILLHSRLKCDLDYDTVSIPLSMLDWNPFLLHASANKLNEPLFVGGVGQELVLLLRKQHMSGVNSTSRPGRVRH